MKTKLNTRTLPKDRASERVRIAVSRIAGLAFVSGTLILSGASFAQENQAEATPQQQDQNQGMETIVAEPLPIATPAAQAPEPGIARFSVEANSDSVDIKNRHYTVMQYLDGQCSKAGRSARMYRKKFGKETHNFEEKEITSGTEFFFQVEYLEARRQEDRACTVLSGFTPAANRRYKAVYETSGQVSRCSVKIFDVTEEQVEITAISRPERTCFRGKPTNNKNSVPIHTVKPLF